MTTNNPRDEDQAALTSRKATNALAPVGVLGILLGLAGGVLDNGWLVFAGLLTLLAGAAMLAGWGWRHEQSRYRYLAAGMTITAVAGWFATVWLVGFPPAMVRLALTFTAVAAIGAIGMCMNRRTRGCLPVAAGGLSAAGTRALLDNSDGAGAGGEQQ